MPEENNQQNLSGAQYGNENYITWSDGSNNGSNNEGNVSFWEKNKQLRELQKKFYKNGPLKWWRILYYILIVIVFLTYIWVIPFNVFLQEFLLIFLIIGSIIRWLLFLRRKNKEKIIQNKWTWIVWSTVIMFIIIPLNLLTTNYKIYWTFNSFLKSYVVHISELENNGTLDEWVYEKNKDSILNEILNIANEKAWYNFIWEAATEAPKQKLWSEFWDEVFEEFNWILSEKIENWEWR